METWKNACPGDLKRYRIIAQALERHPNLLHSLFQTDRAQLTTSPDQIKRRTGAFSTGEKVLIRAALDIWSDQGGVLLNDLLRLDPINFKNMMMAFAERYRL